MTALTTHWAQLWWARQTADSYTAVSVTQVFYVLCSVHVQLFSHVWLCTPMHSRLLCPWDSPGENAGVARMPPGKNAVSSSRGSSWLRGCICSSCIGRWILYHWATREPPSKRWLRWNPSGERHHWANVLLKSHVVGISGSSWGREYMKVKESEVAQSCPTLCDPVDCSPPGFSVHEILQARTLEWVAISFSKGSSWPRDRTQVSCIAGRGFNLWATRESLNVDFP